MNQERDELTGRVIGAAIEVHNLLGPGLLESAYSRCLAHELALRGIAFQQELPLSLVYKDLEVDFAYKMDFVVEGHLLLEIKAQEGLHAVHEAQTLTYLRLSGIKKGLLINFNVAKLKDGIRRYVF